MSLDLWKEYEHAKTYLSEKRYSKRLNNFYFNVYVPKFGDKRIWFDWYKIQTVRQLSQMYVRYCIQENVKGFN